MQNVILLDYFIGLNDMKPVVELKEILAFAHIFERVCNENQIEHRKTKVKHPWSNGQVERMNRILKEYYSSDQIVISTF